MKFKTRQQSPGTKSTEHMELYSHVSDMTDDIVDLASRTFPAKVRCQKFNVVPGQPLKIKGAVGAQLINSGGVKIIEQSVGADANGNLEIQLSFSSNKNQTTMTFLIFEELQ